MKPIHRALTEELLKSSTRVVADVLGLSWVNDDEVTERVINGLVSYRVACGPYGRGEPARAYDLMIAEVCGLDVAEAERVISLLRESEQRIVEDGGPGNVELDEDTKREIAAGVERAHERRTARKEAEGG